MRGLTEAAHPGKGSLRRQSRSALYPQVLQIVQEYVRTRVDNPVHPCEIGLQTYAQRIVSLLLDAIEPDEAHGETPLIPRLNRYQPIGSTAPQVQCYARNDHLEFNIPYELFGALHAYEPDFLVRLANGVTLVVENKGQPHGDTEAKHQAARRWVSAVTRWNRLGPWDFLVCRDPQGLGKELVRFAV